MSLQKGFVEKTFVLCSSDTQKIRNLEGEKPSVQLNPDDLSVAENLVGELIITEDRYSFDIVPVTPVEASGYIKAIAEDLAKYWIFQSKTNIDIHIMSFEMLQNQNDEYIGKFEAWIHDVGNIVYC